MISCKVVMIRNGTEEIKRLNTLARVLNTRRIVKMEYITYQNQITIIVFFSDDTEIQIEFNRVEDAKRILSRYFDYRQQVTVFHLGKVQTMRVNDISGFVEGNTWNLM
jgi:hypothetical protein